MLPKAVFIKHHPDKSRGAVLGLVMLAGWVNPVHDINTSCEIKKKTVNRRAAVTTKFRPSQWNLLRALNIKSRENQVQAEVRSYLELSKENRLSCNSVKYNQNGLFSNTKFFRIVSLWLDSVEKNVYSSMWLSVVCVAMHGY